MTAIVLSAAGGALIAYDDARLAVPVVAAVFLLAGAALLVPRVLAKPRTTIFILGCGAVLLIAEDGLRFGASTTYSDLLLVITGGMLVVAVILGDRLPHMPGWLFVGAALIALSAVIAEIFPPPVLSPALVDLVQTQNLVTGSTGVSSNPVMVSRLLVAIFAAPLIVGLAPTDWKQSRMLVNMWLGGVALSCGIGILAALTPIDLQHSLTGVQYSQLSSAAYAGRVSGLSVNGSALGLTAALTLPVAFSRMVTVANGIRYLPLVVIYILATLVSGSRSAVLLCGVGFVLVFAWQYRARRQLVVLAGATTALLVVLWPTIAALSAVQRLLGGTSVAATTAQNSNAAHLSRVSEGLQVFLQRPMGYGFQAIRGAHDVALQLLDSGGPIAFAGYAIILGGALRLGLALRRHVPPEIDADLAGLVGSIAVWVVATIVNSASYDRYLYIPVGLLLAIYFVSRRQARSETGRRPRADRFATPPVDSSASQASNGHESSAQNGRERRLPRAPYGQPRSGARASLLRTKP